MQASGWKFRSYDSDVVMFYFCNFEEAKNVKFNTARERERVLVYHVNGDGTNQDTLLCCRVWSEPQAVHKLQPRCRPCTSWFVSWSPAHRSQSTDSMTTIPPTAHALRTPTNMTHKKTRHGDEGWERKGRRRSGASHCRQEGLRMRKTRD